MLVALKSDILIWHVALISCDRKTSGKQLVIT